MTLQKKLFGYSKPNDSLWIKQAARFLIVGFSNTLIDFCLYYFLTRWLHVFTLWKTGAKCISYAIGTLNSFYWNKPWTFQSHVRLGESLFPFILTNLAGWVINIWVMQFFLITLRVPELLALGMATSCSLLWNFTISRGLIFNKRG